MRRELVVSFGIVAVLVLSAGSLAAEEDVLVVDTGGGAEYRSLQAAVDAAEPGDTVRVRSGTYREQVTVEKDLRIVAPNGAVLNGSGTDRRTAIDIGSDAGVLVDGLTITGYTTGINAQGTDGEWRLRNVTVRDVEFAAVAAGGSTGDWTVTDLSVRNTSSGVSAASTSGDWRVSDTEIRNVREGHAIEAKSSTGNWTLDTVTVSNVDFVGVSASFTEGDWRMRNVTIRNATVGIGAIEAGGNWSIRGSAIVDASVSERYDFMQPALEEGVGLYARDTTGSWTVHDTRFDDNEGAGIVAEGADPTGNATQNWWGGEGPRCRGNVDCESSPTTQPPEGTTVETSSPTRSPTATAGGTTHSEPATTTSAPGFGLVITGLLVPGIVVMATIYRRG